jgi:DNA (cytosine-5)-methyltransferase 1
MKLLRVGTDCSGIEAPIQALLQLNIPHKHIFSSEIDKFCIKSIKANYNPEIIFGDKDGPYPEGDITKRNLKDIPDIDLYVCGFPCQPFSMAGKRGGFDDNRGNVFFSCINVIEYKQPTYFILENVKGILSHDKGNTWKIILNELEKLKKYNYNIYWKILNTKDYGIPQNRERIFIIGTKYNFEWPEKQPMDKLENYIDYEDKTIFNNNRLFFNKIPKYSLFVDLNFIKYNKYLNSNLFSPCLNTGNGLWNVKLNRYANIKEYLKLQGFDVTFNYVISKTQIKKQIGNSISINVLKAIIFQIF